VVRFLLDSSIIRLLRVGKTVMYCTNCGKELAPESKFCAFCGTKINPNGSPLPADVQTPATGTTSYDSPVTPTRMPPVGPSQPVASRPRPWVRWWARILDVYLAFLVIGLAIGCINTNAFESINSQLLGMAFIFVWMFIEACLLSTLGTTPGKWLFKTKISTSSGDKLVFSTALSRSFNVWLRGLGMGVPIVTIIIQIGAYINLKKNGVTTWDRDDGLVVVHERIGAIRVLGAIVFFAAFFILIAAARNV